MTLVEKALKIALEAHAGQTDKAGAPYVLHPIRVMLKMESEELQAAALLHDVLEDSGFTEEDLRARGIPEDVVDIVKRLTKPEDGGYDDYLGGVIYHPDAIRVKLADIEDNLNVLRIGALRAKDLDRVARYHRAWHVLRGALRERTPYLVTC